MHTQLAHWRENSHFSRRMIKCTLKNVFEMILQVFFFSLLLFTSLQSHILHDLTRRPHNVPCNSVCCLLFYKFNFSCVSFTFHIFLVLTFLRMAKSIYKRNTKISYFVYFSCRNTQPATRRRRLRRRRRRRTYRYIYTDECVYTAVLASGSGHHLNT